MPHAQVVGEFAALSHPSFQGLNLPPLRGLSGAFFERAKGLEPSTLGLGSRCNHAWIKAFGSAMPKAVRSNPLEPAPSRGPLARTGPQ